MTVLKNTGKCYVMENVSDQCCPSKNKKYNAEFLFFEHVRVFGGELVYYLETIKSIEKKKRKQENVL